MRAAESRNDRPGDAREPSNAAIAVAGLIALAVAMGIGRFAFTPILPMMLAEGTVDLGRASWLASANYLGYLAGAVLCTLTPWWRRRLGRDPAVDAPRRVRGGLAATVLLTLAMAAPWPAAWPFLRFAAGVASAVVFVYSSGWCLGALAVRGVPSLGGVMYAGPGAGIVVSGLLASALVAGGGRAAVGWLVFGGLAAALTLAAWRVFSSDDRGGATPGEAVPSRSAAASVVGAPGVAVVSASAPGTNQAHPAHGPRDRRASAGQVVMLALTYGLAGLGYIVTATFLPVIARAALPGSAALDLFWPIFGLGIVVGALLATRLRLAGDLRHLLAAAYVVQAAAIVVGIAWPSLGGFAASSLLLGLPFTAITFFAMQEVRRLRPAEAASTMGLVTAVYGVGQIVGPPLVALLLGHSANAAQGFARALGVAAAALVVGALLYETMVWRWPRRAVEAPAR